MARGWESKSIEMQMEDRERRRSPSENPHPDPASEREYEILRMTRKRLLREIRDTTDPRLREIRERALAHTESALRAHQLYKP